MPSLRQPFSCRFTKNLVHFDVDPVPPVASQAATVVPPSVARVTCAGIFVGYTGKCGLYNAVAVIAIFHRRVFVDLAGQFLPGYFILSSGIPVS